MVPGAEGQTRTHSVGLVVDRIFAACFVGVLVGRFDALVGRFDVGCFFCALVGRFDGFFNVGALVVG